MTLTTCSECKGKMSDRASMCPHCGFGLGQALEDMVQMHVQRAVQAALPLRPPLAVPGEEKRRHRRIDHNTMVKVEGETAMLFNISRSGLKLSSPFAPRTGNVAISLETGDRTYALKGTVRWVSARRSFSNLVDFGVEIIEAPPEYYEFVDQLKPAR
jgi:hypothetical protein